MKKILNTLLSFVTIFLMILISACTGKPTGTKVVLNFELDKYLGTWYEIARLDHRFERGLQNVTANYSLREDGGVRVINRGFNAKKNEWDQAQGKAYLTGPPDVGRLKVSFFGPFYGGYNILELDSKDYQYALIAGPNRSYLWILSRTPELPETVLRDLVKKARDMNFEVDKLIYVTHDDS
tara:strand:+ start:884 stop:1426 length:543 start_codon:yes stop_codon:yes gene_type:complete